jgi:hypothetical protein
MEGLGGVLDGHLKGQMQLIKIPPQFVASIEELKIKLHFLNLGTPPNGQEELKLHNQNRAAARFPSAMCFLRTSQCFGWHDPNFSRVAASEGSMTVPAVQTTDVDLGFFA